MKLASRGSISQTILGKAQMHQNIKDAIYFHPQTCIQLELTYASNFYTIYHTMFALYSNGARSAHEMLLKLAPGFKSHYQTL